MNLIKSFLFLLFLSINFFIVPNTTHDTDIKHTEIEEQNQYIVNLNDPDVIDHFFKLPRYTKSSYIWFLKNTYNHCAYAPKFLALNFAHVATFLSYTGECEHPRAYVKSVLDLFAQKLKFTTYINTYAFSEFLGKLPSLVNPYFNQQAEQQEKREIIKTCLTSFFENKFEQLKRNPELALEELAQNIYNSSFKELRENSDISVFELQHSMFEFLEIGLNRLIWSPVDQKDIWLSVKIISKQLEELLAQNMVSSVDNLDKLYWSMITRFDYFLREMGSELTPICYEEINQDLATQKDSLWVLEEREHYITTKLDFLNKSVIQAQLACKLAQG